MPLEACGVQHKFVLWSAAVHRNSWICCSADVASLSGTPRPMGRGDINGTQHPTTGVSDSNTHDAPGPLGSQQMERIADSHN